MNLPKENLTLIRLPEVRLKGPTYCDVFTLGVRIKVYIIFHRSLYLIVKMVLSWSDFEKSSEMCCFDMVVDEKT